MKNVLGLRALFIWLFLSYCILPCGAQSDSTQIAQGGSIEFSEYKKVSRVRLEVSQSRVFKLANRIVRTSIADPSIAVPVVVGPNDLVLLGKYPGTTTMFLWDEAGGVVGFDIGVTESRSIRGELASVVGFYKRIFRPGNKLIHTDSVSKLILEEVRLEKPEDYYFTVARGNCVVWRPPNPGSWRVSGLPQKKPEYTFEDKGKTGPRDYVHKIPFSKHKVKYKHRKVTSKGNSLELNLQVSKSRLLRSNKSIAKTVMGDAKVAEPVLVSPNEIVVLGKRKGVSKNEFEDVHKNSSTITFNLKRKRLFGFILSGRKETFIPPVYGPAIKFTEAKIQRTISIKSTEPKIFKSKKKIVRVLASDPELVKLAMVSPKHIFVDGLGEGVVSIFVWDEEGAVEGITVKLTCNHHKKMAIKEHVLEGTFPEETRTVIPVHDVEVWAGAKHLISSIPMTKKMESGELP